MGKYIECHNCKYQYDCDRTYLGGCTDGEEWGTKMSFNKNNTDEYSTKVMMAYPITPLARMIGRCWFLGSEKLAEKAGVPLYTVVKALRGEEIAARFERKIIAVLI